MRLSFDSIDEVKAFVAELKATRGGKNKDKDDAGSEAATGGAPAPMLPPSGAAGAVAGNVGQGPEAGAFTGFAPPAAGAGPGPGFVAPAAQAATGPSPEVADLVKRIVVRLDAALASGQPQDAALVWFRTECGANAAQATFDQIKTHHLFQQPMDKLTYIAKVMNA